MKIYFKLYINLIVDFFAVRMINNYRKIELLVPYLSKHSICLLHLRHISLIHILLFHGSFCIHVSKLRFSSQHKLYFRLLHELQMLLCCYCWCCCVQEVITHFALSSVRYHLLEMILFDENSCHSNHSTSYSVESPRYIKLALVFWPC